MRRRTLFTSLAALVVAAAGVVVGAGPAVAIPECDVPSPPPICGGTDHTKSPTITLDTPRRTPAGLVVSGQAVDPDATDPLQVVLTLPGTSGATVTARGGRYSATLPASSGELCASAINQGRGETRTFCRHVDEAVNPFGSLDVVTPGPGGLRVQGWTIDPDTAASIDIHIYVDGAYKTGTHASVSRPDVADVYPEYGAAHGYDITVPVNPGTRTVCTWGINVAAGNENRQLGCMTVEMGARPGTPGITVEAAPDDAEITVTVRNYDEQENVTDILVERSTPEEPGYWHRPNTFPSVPFAHVAGVLSDRTVVRGRTYCFRATARNPYGNSVGDTVCARVTNPSLPQPTDLAATEVGQDALTLTWTDNATNELRYEITRPGAEPVVLPARAGTGAMSQRITDLRPDTEYCFEIQAVGDFTGHNPARFCVRTAAAPPPPQTGIKTLRIWNCEAGRRPGSIWMWDYTVGGWRRMADAPSSWAGGCGPAYSGPAATVNLPDSHIVNVVEVVRNAMCTVDDPNQAACRHWESGPVLGDSSGITVPVVIP